MRPHKINELMWTKIFELKILGIATDSTHPFSMRAMQEYCDKEKKLKVFILLTILFTNSFRIK